MNDRVRTFRVQGIALFSPDRTRFWQRFSIEVRAVDREDALEKVYSLMGSRHKLRREHLKILEVVEIRPEEARSRHVRELARLEGW